MTPFDLLFLLLLVVAAGGLIWAGVTALRGRRTRAAAVLKCCGIGATVYLGIVVAASVLSPQRFALRGEDQCSDDWCVAVTTSTRTLGPEGDRIEVVFRVSSVARAVAQRERFVAVYLRDTAGHRYDPQADSGGVAFDTLLAPGQSLTAVRHFLVPAAAAIAGVVIAREGAGRFPGCCIIGDEGSLLHKRTIVRLD